jgi:hypothetical protein
VTGLDGVDFKAVRIDSPATDRQFNELIASESAFSVRVEPERERKGCLVDVGSVAPPREGQPCAEVRFTITNTLQRRLLITSIKLRVEKVLEIETTMGATTAGPVDERYLTGKIGPDTRDIQLLPTPHVVKVDETEGFFLKLQAEEGYKYELSIIAEWKFIEMTGARTEESAEFAIEFPIRSVKGLMRLAKRRTA